MVAEQLARPAGYARARRRRRWLRAIISSARSTWGQDRPGILVLSHLDTVHPMGLHRAPAVQGRRRQRVRSRHLRHEGAAPTSPIAPFARSAPPGDRSPLGITHVFTSDEEIGSPTSRALIEAEGRKAKYVLVTEPARDGGKIVTGRKGVGRFEVFIKGVPAHAGTRPQDGRSAIRELANVIQALEAMNDLARGVTVNVGVARGGTRPNVTPEEAYAEVDLRVPSVADADEFVGKILGLTSKTDGVTVRGHGRAQPSALREEQCRRLAVRACHDACRRDRLRADRHLTGGGSDGNFTAAHTATLDGLGVDGKGAHPL